MSNSKMRMNAFNLYVAFMIFPDSLYAMTMGFLYLSKALQIPLIPPYRVTLYVYYLNLLVNFYSNGVVVYEINKLIQQSNNRRRTQPPQLSRVYKQMFAVYFFATILGTWGILPVSWSLFHVTDNVNGEGDLGSPPGGLLSRMAAIGIAYGTILIPTCYVVYVSIRVWRKRLLPRSGKTRTLSLFFTRVIVVFVVFYFPNTATTALQGRMTTASGSFWIRIVRGLLAAGQVYTTIYLILDKEDIRQATIEACNKTCGRICCKLSNAQRNNRAERGSCHVSGLSLGQPDRRQPQTSTYQQEQTPGQISPTSMKNCQSEWEAEDEYDNIDDTRETIQSQGDNDHNASSEKRDEEEGQRNFTTVDMAGQVNDGSPA